MRRLTDVAVLVFLFAFLCAAWVYEKLTGRRIYPDEGED